MNRLLVRTRAVATFESYGSDGLYSAFKQSSNVPKSVKEDCLSEMAGILADEQYKVGKEKGVYDPNSNDHVLDHIKVNSPSVNEDGGTITITFEGSKKNGRKTVRNAAVAFINEYGCNAKSMKARNFIRTANERARTKANDAGEEVIASWLQSNFS